MAGAVTAAIPVICRQDWDWSSPGTTCNTLLYTLYTVRFTLFIVSHEQFTINCTLCTVPVASPATGSRLAAYQISDHAIAAGQA